MKKLVIAALAIGAMAACTKSNVQYEQPGEISLQPVAQKATKAAVDGTFYPTNQAYNFNVWAVWIDQSAGSVVNLNELQHVEYINQGTFAARDNFNWGGWNGSEHFPYYWPSDGSLIFAGYSPASVKPETQEAGAPSFNYNFETKTFTADNYIQSNDISEAVDLMWFDFDGMSYSQNPSTTDPKGVPVQFQHALSWLTFKFNLNSVNTSDLWTITNVKLTGVENKGNFISNAEPAWTDVVESDEDMDIIELYDDNDGHHVTYYADGTVLPGTDVVTEGTNILDNAVLVIPQSCAPAAAELVITYNMETYVGGNVLPQEVRLPLNGEQINGDKWLPGKHYIYTITFGNNEILISPSVTDWTDIEVDNIPVL